MTEPRGLRNHNPGNIRHSKSKWQGMAEKQTDKDFVTFVSDEYGIRAMVRVLLQYQKRGLDTVGEIIRAYAPPADQNDTESYIKAVCRGCGVLPDDELDLDDAVVMLPLLRAIIKHENGKTLPDAVIMNGMRLAGIHNAAPKPLSASRTVHGASAAGVGTGVVAIAEVTRQVREVQEAVQPGLDAVSWLLSYGVWIALVVALGACGWIAWARWQDHKRLGR